LERTESNGNGHPAAAHFILQGKGGVGKSYVSAILGQYFQQRGQRVHCLDTDPVNATFAQYKRIQVEHLNILRRGAINEKRFDQLVDKICGGEGVFVIDTGATTFVPLWNYILESRVVEFLRARGGAVYVHTIVTGGQAMSDTLHGLERLAETATEKNIVVWLNEFFGEVADNGKGFTEFSAAKEHAASILGVVVMSEHNPQTYGDDIRHMLERRLTFDEAIQSADFSLIAKQRLTIVRREIFDQIDALRIE
jgi:hypothetical protein